MISGASGGVGLVAFFTDAGESTDNVFGAATVDLKLNGDDSISATIGGTAMLPGVAADCESTDIAVTHTGTADADDLRLDITVSFTGHNEMAQYLDVTGTTYDGASVVPPDGDGLGGPSVSDWVDDDLNSVDLASPVAGGTPAKTLHIEVCLHADAPNSVQGAEVDVTWHFNLRQELDFTSGLPFSAPAGMEYFTPVSVQNDNGALGDHQVLSSIDTALLVSAGRMQADCDDLRVYDAAGTALPFWIESGCNTSSTRVWFKAPTLPGGASTDFYLLHGDDSASAAGSIADTFIADTMAVRGGSCTNTAECGYADNSAEMNTVRQNAADHCDTTATSIDWGSFCDASAFGSTVREEFYNRYRFIFAPTTTGTWTFATDSDDASDLVANPGDAFDVASASVVTSWYGAHAHCNCTTHQGSTSIGTALWLDYSMNDWSGFEAGRLWAKSPGAGSFSIMSTANFPDQIFAREYAPVEPVATQGSTGLA